MSFFRTKNRLLYWKRCLGWIVAVSFLILAGCAADEKAGLEGYVEELEFDNSFEAVEDIPLGDYRIAAALPGPKNTFRDIGPMWVQLQFSLYAVVVPENKKIVESSVELHRGMLDDAVVTICRSASVDELSDSRLSTLKARLIDSIRPILGENRVRRLTFEPFSWEPI